MGKNYCLQVGKTPSGPHPRLECKFRVKIINT